MAKQISKKAEKATSPFQHALTTKGGCECVAHVLQTVTDKDELATVVSIDGAYDLIFRNTMMEGFSGWKRRSGSPVRAVFLWKPVEMKSATRRTSHKGTEGTGRPPHATVRTGLSSSVECKQG